MISASQLRNHIIVPVLQTLDSAQPGFDSLAAQNLLLGTAAKESAMGKYLVQLAGGPAKSIYQLEPETAETIYRWLSRDDHCMIKLAVDELTIPGIDAFEQLGGNLYLATALCRIRYYMDPAPLPDASNIQALAALWKRVWNTRLGKGTVDEFVDCYGECVGVA